MTGWISSRVYLAKGSNKRKMRFPVCLRRKCEISSEWIPVPVIGHRDSFTDSRVRVSRKYWVPRVREAEMACWALASSTGPRSLNDWVLARAAGAEMACWALASSTGPRSWTDRVLASGEGVPKTLCKRLGLNWCSDDLRKDFAAYATSTSIESICKYVPDIYILRIYYIYQVYIIYILYTGIL